MDIKNHLKGKNIFITGGTGSIGQVLLKKILEYNPAKIIVFSRDENKQHNLKLKYPNDSKLKYIIGDVRDFESIKEHSKNTDVLFHCAALKHVPISEENPEEFIKTNILGAINVKKAALVNEIPIVVSISTDKTVNPTNVMGLTKAIQEKVFSTNHLVNQKSKTKCVNVRFGNVIGTKGSLFPILYYQIKNNKPLTLTHPEMTRFFMTKDNATNLILNAMADGEDGDTFILKMKSVKIRHLFALFLKSCGKPAMYPINETGIRVGEKIHEALITEDECFRCIVSDGHIVIKPYHIQEIEENIIKQRVKNKKVSLEKFTSNYKNNFFSDKEMIHCIKEFLDEQK